MKKPPKEKRLARIRTSCSAKTRERITRAMTQRIFMVNWEQKDEFTREYAVLGSTGNLYTVTISRLINCTCPDFTRGNTCKHQLFVMLKVLKLSQSSTFVYQKALLTTELKSIFESSPSLVMLSRENVRANSRVCKSYNKMMGVDGSDESADSADSGGVKQKPTEDNECPICLEDFDDTPNEKVVWCEGQCGNNIHAKCFGMYSANKGH
eukprot:UN25638